MCYGALVLSLLNAVRLKRGRFLLITEEIYMAHQAIYRKWRPTTFDDIVGQEHITRTLKNQILSDAVGHAYLFCGTRGTGKTTCAKVLSRAVNCLNPQNGNPCNECEICRGIADGSIMDVTEMDAASNNSVDDIRDIIEDINYVASNSKYTVYIIDEVHMLSQSAFNALLKTLEEPPMNVIFILATTEAHKVPQTILSRCQRFDFKRIRTEDIIVRMKEIAYADGYEITEEAYRILATLAEGSLRDGLSIMERVISASGTKMDAQDIQNALGISGKDALFELTDAIINTDTAKVITIIDKVLSDGKDLTQLAVSMLEHFRCLMLCKVSNEPEAIIQTDAQTLKSYRSQSERLSFEKINHATTLISEAIADARVSKSSRIVYELAFLKLARPDISSSPESVLDRIATLEGRVYSQTPVPVQTQTTTYDNTDILNRLIAIEAAIKNGISPVNEPEKETQEPEVAKSVRMYSPIPESELNFDYPTAALARNWENLLQLMIDRGGPYAAPLKNCVVTFDAEGIIVLVPEERYNFTEKISISNIDKIRKLFSEVTGTNFTIKIMKRGEFDERLFLNPYNLPKTESLQAPEEVDVKPQTAAEEQIDKTDKLNDFFDKFSEIITDGDRQSIFTDEPMQVGEQSVIDDDREEFLDESEMSDNEDEENL